MDRAQEWWKDVFSLMKREEGERDDTTLLKETGRDT
jgi:hypothetical protein